MASRLTTLGLPTRAYHAGLGKVERESTQNEWSHGVFPVVAATISFGMGVDRANVRFVFHWTLPKSMAAYYQESGRAGRDGVKAYCRLYCLQRERNAVLFLTNKNSGRQSKQARNQEYRKSDLDQMISYVESTKCRHRQISDYFGDEPPDCGNKCDVCVDKTGVASQLAAYRGMAWQSRTKVSNNVNPDPNHQDDEMANSDELAEADRCARQSVIAKEFEKRRRNTEAAGLKSSWCAAPEQTQLLSPDNRTLTGITGLARDQTLRLLITALQARFSDNPDGGQAVSDLCARAEYQLFRESKIVAMYRSRMARLITQVRRAQNTDQAAWEMVESKTGEVPQTDTSCAPMESCSSLPGPAKVTNDVTSCLKVAKVEPSPSLNSTTKRGFESAKLMGFTSAASKLGNLDSFLKPSNSTVCLPQREPSLTMKKEPVVESNLDLIKDDRFERASKVLHMLNIPSPERTVKMEPIESDRGDCSASISTMLPSISMERDIRMDLPVPEPIKVKYEQPTFPRRPEEKSESHFRRLDRHSMKRELFHSDEDAVKRPKLTAASIPPKHSPVAHSGWINPSADLHGVRLKTPSRTCPSPPLDPNAKPIKYFWEQKNPPSQAPEPLIHPPPLPAPSIMKEQPKRPNVKSIKRIPKELEKIHSKAKPHATAVAKQVVASLSRHFAKNRFHSKDVFKSVAKELTRRLLDSGAVEELVAKLDSIVDKVVTSTSIKPIKGAENLDWSIITSKPTASCS